jgi:hypothetical protein
MLPDLRAIRSSLLLAGMLALAQNPVEATTIASDDFLTGGSGDYSATNVNGQIITAGTTGYFIGTASGNLAPGWTSGTGAFVAQAIGLTNPNVINPPSSNDGSLTIVGNANTRLQYRDLSSASPPASSDYYFSLLLSESANSYTGTAYAGLGLARATGGNALIPATGFDIGFLNGQLSLFYNNGGANLASESLLTGSPVDNQTYMVALHLNMTGPSSGTITPSVYDNTGTLINSPASQAVAVTENTATDMGAFQGFVTNNFNGTIPAKVTFDEFRFGTAASDVTAVPEPGSAGLLAMSAAALFGGWRKRRRTRGI